MRLAVWAIFALIGHAGTTPAELLRQAEEHINKDQFAQAEPLFEQVLREQPGNVEARYRLGYVQYRQRKVSEARQNFNAVVLAAPPAHHSRYFLGRIALIENQPAEAIRWLEPAVAAKQTKFDAASQLASAYVAAGQSRLAVAPLKSAISETPWDAALYYRLGQLHRQLGEEALAQEAFATNTRLRTATREDVETLTQASQAVQVGRTAEVVDLGARILNRPDADPNTLVALGVIYGNASRHAEALEVFERAARRDPRIFQVQFNFGLALLKAGRAADAMTPLARSVELLPQSFEANMTYGLASVMNQRYGDAVSPLERAWRMDSSNARVGALLATAYLRTGAPAKAVPILRDLSRSGSNDPAPALLLVEALNATEDSMGALEAARQVQRSFPKLPQAHMAAAQQLARLGRYQEARPVFEEILRLAPGQPEAELGLAEALQKAGEHGGAVEHYRKAMESHATGLGARLGLARSLIALKQLEPARLVLEEASTQASNDISVRLALSGVYARLGLRDLAAEQTRIAERLRAAQGSR